jgi:hypothetical protein
MSLNVAPIAREETYEACDQCGAPVEASQRYCVICGVRRTHAHDPAARFMADATSRSRAAARPAAGGTSTSGRQRSPGLGTAGLIAMIPLALGLGVLLGRAGNGQDAKLLAALRAQKPAVVNVSGAPSAAASPSGAHQPASTGAATPASTPVASLSSSFSLQSGYAVELSTLPGAGTDQATVTAAENAARAKGATSVGLISPSDFTVKPPPPASHYVIYSGQYKLQAQAEHALSKLKKAFPNAVVIAVNSTSSSGGGGAVLNTTSYGSFHSVAGLKPPSKSQLAAGAQAAHRVASKINSSYVSSQNGLPNEVSVP